MIDLARASLEHIDERLARISLERESLLALRGAWERFLALGDAPPIEQGAGADQGQPADELRLDGEPALDPVASPPRSLKEPGTGGRIEQPAAGDDPPVPAPSAGAPGSARSGPRVRRGTGRRAPAAAVAAVPRPSSPSGPVGTPTSASTTPPPVAPMAADPASIACQFCHRPFPDRRGFALHERRCEKNPDRPPPWVPKPVSTGGNGVAPKASRESYICARCPAAFTTAEKRDLHQNDPEIHPPVVETTKPVGRNPTTSRGMPAGVPVA